MRLRCPDYWDLDRKWRIASKDEVARLHQEDSKALQAIRAHMATCAQCGAWWQEQIQILKGQERKSE